MKKRFTQIAVTVLLMIITAIVTVFVMLEIKDVSHSESEPLSIESDIKDIDTGGFDNSVSTNEIGYIILNGTDTLFIEDGKIKASPLLCNYNKNYFLRIVLKLENGEELYRSGLIPSMKGVSDVAVNKRLNIGDYSATIIYEYFNSRGNEIASQLNVNVKLVVK